MYTSAAILLLVWLLVSMFASAESKARPAKAPPTLPTKPPIKIKESRGFRHVQWCIDGYEPEFQRFPYNQFKPFLSKDKYLKGNNAFKYEIKLNHIEVDGNALGDSQFLQNTAHFQFKAWKRRLFSGDAQIDFQVADLEGLIVQMVYAPMGVGLPTGTFLDPEDMNCFDCQYPLGTPVGCKQKTWFNFMHPTVLVFHHQSQTSEVELSRTKEFCDDKQIQKYCDGKPPMKCESRSTCVTGTPPEPDCKRVPADFSCQLEDIDKPGAYTPMFIDDKADPKVPITCNKNPPTVTGINEPDQKLCEATGIHDPPWFCRPFIDEARDKIPGIDCEPMKEFYGRTVEVHGNLIWFTHPCHYTRRVRFIYLAVHSFSQGLYSMGMTGVFVLPDIQADDHNKFIPSPAFTGFRHICEPSTPKSKGVKAGTKDSKIVEEIIEGFTEFDFSQTYDACIRDKGTTVFEELDVHCMYNSTTGDSTNPGTVLRQAPSVRAKKFEPPPRCIQTLKYDDDRILDYDTESSKKDVATCDARCPQLPTTSTTPQPVKVESPIKRTFHGGINLMCSFCIMPITVFIARFYKETFNQATVKGAKAWYWMHVFGSGGSSILMYFGYFSEKSDSDADPHTATGNLYIVFLAVAYVSSWARHRDEFYTQIAEIVHGGCGYMCFILALSCVHTAPRLDILPLIFVYCAVGALGLFYVGMTVHICALDRKFGMNPKRRHFPTVEARFDDLPVPKAGLRKIYLVILVLIVFPLMVGTLFT